MELSPKISNLSLITKNILPRFNYLGSFYLKKYYFFINLLYAKNNGEFNKVKITTGINPSEINPIKILKRSLKIELSEYQLYGIILPIIDTNIIVLGKTIKIISTNSIIINPTK